MTKEGCEEISKIVIKENGAETKEETDAEVEIELTEKLQENTCDEGDKKTELVKNNNICSCTLYLTKIKDLEEKCLELSNTNNDLDSKLKTLRQKYENAHKEKEAMIVRYAVNEKGVIDQKIQTEKAEKKLKDVIRENEILQHKVAMMCSEKNRICQILDNKCHELKSSQQELDSLKSDFSILETKLKWCQSNLKNQIESNKEKDENIDNLNKKLQDVNNQIEKTKSDAEEYIKTFRYSQNNEAFVLGKQVQELQAQLILLKHENGEKELHINKLQSQIEKFKSKEFEIVKENTELTLKLDELQRKLEILIEENKLLKNSSENQKNLMEELTNKNLEIEQLKCMKKVKEEQIEELNMQLSNFKHKNIDLELDIKSCKERESDMLIFTKQLTDKNVTLQSEFSTIEAKVQQLVKEQVSLKKSLKEYEINVNNLSNELSKEQKKYSDETVFLTNELDDKRKKCEALAQELADCKGESLVIKRKMELSLREVTKELQHCRKKLEQNECLSNCTSSSSSTISVGDGNANSPATEEIKVIQPEMAIEKQTLIDHIVKLQRISAKKSEKIDFLEEHVNTLVEELQKKSRLLQNYMLHDHSGALSSNSMENNKANIAKSHGIMASMYGSKITDSTFTLELSLDINRKLQAVLEDALLKNITLKENVDTLGCEIDRLNKLINK